MRIPQTLGGECPIKVMRPTDRAIIRGHPSRKLTESWYDLTSSFAFRANSLVLEIDRFRPKWNYTAPLAFRARAVCWVL